MYNENNFYMVGKSETEILCYDEQKDWRYEQCLYFSNNPVMMPHMTYSEANEYARENQKHFPDNKLLIYFYKTTESIEEMPFIDEKNALPIQPK